LERFAMQRESSSPASQCAEIEHPVRTHWLPAVIYLAAGLFLVAIVRCIGV
jgi:hypothetical protein